MSFMRKSFIITAFAILAGCGLSTSCNEYTDDLQGIGKRVEVLEDSALSVRNTYDVITKLETAMKTYGVISNIKTNADGSTTLEFVDGREPITFMNGADGKSTETLLGVKEDTDGHTYWIFNGDWLRDKDGNKVSAEPMDGKDGKDGKNGTDGKDGKDADPVDGDVILPQVRINPATRIWEISTDGGRTWGSTGVYADGKNGADGQDGQDGVDGRDGRDGKNGQDGENGEPDPIIISAIVRGNVVLFTVRIFDETTMEYTLKTYSLRIVNVS